MKTVDITVVFRATVPDDTDINDLTIRCPIIPSVYIYGNTRHYYRLGDVDSYQTVDTTLVEG